MDCDSSAFVTQVSYLEKKVTELESDSLANSDLKSKLKHENTHLVHRWEKHPVHAGVFSSCDSS